MSQHLNESPRCLSESSIRLLKSTSAILSTEGTKVTSRMYEIMLSNYPIVKNLFNTSHVRKNGNSNTVAPQAQALANAVFRFAANADNLTALQDMLKLIAHKHVSFNILPEHYPIVGNCLLRAIKDVLQDAVTDEVMEAWREGYDYLADLFIKMENDIKEQNKMKGGWVGFKPLIVSEKIKETEDITSFILKAPNGEDLPDFISGQYISIRIPNGKIDTVEHDVVRNYSLSSMCCRKFFKISIKKEISSKLLSPDGIASVYFHNNVNVGDEVLVGNPCGTFFLKKDLPSHILISAGVGLTPMISMIETLLSTNDNCNQILFIHCAKSEAHFAMKQHVEELCKNTRLTSHVFYSKEQEVRELESKIITHNSHLTKEVLESIVSMPSNHNYYICGPPRFLHFVKGALEEMNVPAKKINYEYFGPKQEYL
ncbi:flavohemoprotein isoform X1 [Hydra vulgaris]|uniref:flavohemoprotein isoform X1 n=1 Tax=Hydra vulgaris TaxID=6087 RepID=UPI001F5E6DB4|nr:flavohemoprotein [Hydra vulgaris]